MCHAWELNSPSIITFAKQQSRFPNSTELQNMRCYGEIPCDLDNASDFKIKLEFFEKLVEFQEKEGRFPDNDELPDPFEKWGVMWWNKLLVEKKRDYE